MVYFIGRGDKQVDQEVGWYTCSATNKFGSAAEEFELLD